MTLHVFNPEHDIALASNLANFTAPHAGRQLRADMGFLPALWAADDDAVLVDNVEYAHYRYSRLKSRVGGRQPLFVDRHQLARLHITRVEPWGWNRALVAQLRRYGVTTLPDDAYVDELRQLSHRRTSATLLPLLRGEGTVGEAFECTSSDDVSTLLTRYGELVLKAPWSSSGRGLRFLSLQRTPLSMHAGWLRNVLAAQGSVMAEPRYAKVKDFGMEFSVDASGTVSYEGLSLFHTKNGAYTGNIIATEQVKRDLLARLLPLRLIDDVRDKVCSLLRLGRYVGPFGIDMMVVAPAADLPSASQPSTGPFLLHPCVELNLRRTMGHVALSLSPDDDDIRRVMRIELTDHYKLKIQKL